jgi:hypothetical protein
MTFTVLITAFSGSSVMDPVPSLLQETAITEQVVGEIENSG